jgi:hypothetical protein
VSCPQPFYFYLAAFATTPTAACMQLAIGLREQRHSLIEYLIVNHAILLRNTDANCVTGVHSQRKGWCLVKTALGTSYPLAYGEARSHSRISKTSQLFIIASKTSSCSACESRKPVPVCSSTRSSEWQERRCHQSFKSGLA